MSGSNWGSLTFGLLGPLEVRAGQAPIRIAANKQRTVLAMLLVNAGTTVTMPALTAEVWGDDPPRSAALNLRSYVMQLRRQVAGDSLVTSPAGYLLKVGEHELDLLQFQSECARGRTAIARGDLRTADQALGNALGLWRGRAVEDIASGPKLRAAAEQLTEQHLAAAEDHADVQLALGKHAAVARTFRGLAEQYPLRESIRSRLMLALYRSGDVAGALDVYDRVRGALAEKLNLAPGPDLVRRHLEILRRDPALIAPVRARRQPLRPRQLPRPPSLLVGRAAELAEVAAATRSGTAVVHGLCGAGKSALALHAAHAVKQHYPDGQLYADLLGGLAPFEILHRFLRALGVPPDDLSTGLSEAQAQYRSLLAGRRILVVLDNATDSAQVKPLLPAESGCAAIVTSGGPMPDLSSAAVAVDCLDESQALQLLSETAGPQRIQAEPEAARAIAKWCGRHPLALRIAGARLAARPDWSLARLEQRLRPRQRRLDELRMDDLSIRTSFATRYQLLRSAAAQAFRRISTIDAPDFGIRQAVSVLSAQPARARELLTELTASGLLMPVGAGRFRMPELLRLYASDAL